MIARPERLGTLPLPAARRPAATASLRYEHCHRQPRARPAAPRPQLPGRATASRVHFQVIEGTRRRTQVFEGVVIKRQGHGVRETFTVRKQSFGVGVERTFPVHSPKIEQIEVAARGDVRRAKLYYLRDRVGKRARVRERRYTGPEEVVERGLLHDPAEELEAEAAPAEAVDAEGAPRRPSAERGRRGRRRGRDARDGGDRPRRAPADAEAEADAEAAGDAAADERAARQPRRDDKTEGVVRGETSGSLVELVVIVAVALGLALGIQAFLVKPYRIPSESMVPTLADRPARARQPHRRRASATPDVGDIVVFHPPAGAEQTTPCGAPAAATARPATSRRRRAPTSTSSSASSPVRATGSAIDDGHVVLNGKRQKEPFAAPCGACDGAATSRRRSRFRPVTTS